MQCACATLSPVAGCGRLTNRTWTGLRDGLENDIADIALDAWSNNLEDHLLFQDTERYFTDRVTWYTPTNKNPSV